MYPRLSCTRMSTIRISGGCIYHLGQPPTQGMFIIIPLCVHLPGCKQSRITWNYFSKMAANFWLSTHCKYWLLTKEELVTSAGRQEDLKYLTAEEYQKVHILFANFIQALGEHLKHRQQVIAAATQYFKRFYSKNSLKNIDPLLLAPTCLYLASKVEENGVISNTRLIQTCATVVKNKFLSVFNCEYPYRINQVYFPWLLKSRFHRLSLN